MAKFVKRNLSGTFEQNLRKIEDGILNSSISATLEDSNDFLGSSSRCSVRVFERYSYMGGNRVSLNVTLFEADGQVHLSAITSGGSQAMFWKINTVGEEQFLRCLEKLF